MFRRKAVVDQAEFVTSLARLVDLHPIVPMRKSTPKWLKTQQSRCPVDDPAFPLPGHATIKLCPGVVDLVRLGYMMPAWADITVHFAPDAMDTGAFKGQASTPGQNIGVSGFDRAATGNLPRLNDEYPFTVKLDSPWMMKTPPGWSTMMLPLPYDDVMRPWRVQPGIVDTDRYHAINVVTTWSKQDKPQLIDAGTPLVQLVPFKRADAELPLVVIMDGHRAQNLGTYGRGGTGNGMRIASGGYQRDKKRFEENVVKAGVTRTDS